MKRRTIVVGGEAWEWFCGKGGGVVIWSPDGKRRHTTHAAHVKGINPDTFDRGKWKMTSDGMLRPSEVAALIQELQKQGQGQES